MVANRNWRSQHNKAGYGGFAARVLEMGNRA